MSYGDLNVGERLKKLEALHESGGVCEQHRADLWRALTQLRERLARLETKLLLFGSAIGIAGPLAAQLIWEWAKRK
jgi:hypothetical protein